MTDRIDVHRVVRWADHAAADGGFGEALGWLDAAAALNRGLPERYGPKRAAWMSAARANGGPPAASRVPLDDPHAAAQLVAFSQRLETSMDTATLVGRALEGAMALLGTELGNVQLASLTNGALTIATSSGFDREFLDYFAVVDDGSSACGRAAEQRRPTVIVDVNDDHGFAPHREIAAAARFRAVQSAPIGRPNGRLHGVISTHFREPHSLSQSQLQMIALYAGRIGASLEQGEQRAHGQLASLWPVELDDLVSLLLEFEPFGGGSPELVSWELSVPPEVVRSLWPTLVSDQLVEWVGVDAGTGEQTWRLTDSGRSVAQAAG